MTESDQTLLATRAEGDDSPELAISFDLVKRGVVVAPVLVGLAALLWGTAGAISTLYGTAIVLVNFVLAAATIAFTARISLGLMMGAVLFGFLIRLALIFLAVFPVRDASWISLPALGATIIITHVGLLFWELKYVNISLAASGVTPARQPATRRSLHH